MNPELEKYVNSAHNLHSLYNEADALISECVSRWNGNVGMSDAAAGGRSESVAELQASSFRLIISHMGEVLRNLLYSDPGLFWNGGQKDLCLQLIGPLHRETQKLKRKLQRITEMISGQMKVLTPLIISYSDDSFFLSEIGNRDFNHTTDSAEVEREVLKLMAGGILNKATAKKMGCLNRFKSAVLCGSMSSKKAKVLKSFQARLREIEEEEKSWENSNKAFASMEDITRPADQFVLVWGDEGEKPLEESGPDPEGELINGILSEANAKYFPIPSETVTDTVERAEEDTLNENLNGNEVKVLHAPSTSFSPCYSDLDTQKESMDLPAVPLQFPEDPLTKFKALVKEARDGVARVTSNIRTTERNFYAPPEALVKEVNSSGPALELKHFVEIVEEAGDALQAKLARNERKGKNSFSGEQLDLMKLLGKVYQSGASCLAQLESFTGMVQTGAGDLKGLISEYQPGQDSEDEHFDGPDAYADVKRCNPNQLELLFNGSRNDRDEFIDF